MSQLFDATNRFSAQIKEQTPKIKRPSEVASNETKQVLSLGAARKAKEEAEAATLSLFLLM